MKKDAAKRYLATFFFSLDMLFLLENKIMAHLKFEDPRISKRKRRYGN
jgi:hypothetical protein